MSSTIGATEMCLVVKFMFNNWPLKPPKIITHLKENNFYNLDNKTQVYFISFTL